MIFTISTIAIAVSFIAYGVFAAVAPIQARHAADIVISTLLKRTAGDKARQDVLIERVDLFHNNKRLYAEQHRSEIRSTRLGGISITIASILILLWYLGVIG